MTLQTVDSSTPVSPDSRAAAFDVFLASWNQAALAWDCEGLANCYTPDGLFFGGRPDHFAGRDAIDAYFRSYIGTIVSCTLKLRDQHVVKLGADCLAAQGFGDFTFLLTGGQRTQSVVRTSLILAREEGRWKARLHHFSPAPKNPPLGLEH